MSYIKAIPAVLTKTANYTVSTNDGDNVQVNTSASGGAVTITFYAASGNAGKIITVKKTDSSANAVTLDGNASETLDGATTLTLSAQHDSATLVCDGTNWIKASAMGAGAIPISGMAAGDDIYASSSTQLAAGARQLRQSFRGLTLRTHPDADVAAYKVFLDHADEIVMHDGTRVADWDDLTADITASGAGGLDTGSEGASRWYEIHAIRKSSDGTKNLLLHRTKSYDLDQSLTTGDDADLELRSASGNTRYGQTFQSGVTGYIDFCDFYCKKVSTPTGRVWVTIYATSAGLPTGAAIATSDKLDVSAFPTSSIWTRFIFRTPVSLTSGTTYAVVLEGDYTINGTAYLSFRGDASSPPYASGSAVLYNGTSWSASTGIDVLFRVYSRQNDTAVTMPSGYDQRCLIGYVYNNSSSNFRGFFSRDRDTFGLSGVSGSTIGAVTSTTPTLIDLSAYLPPAPVALWGEPSQTTATDFVNLAPAPDGIKVAGNPPDGGQIFAYPGSGSFVLFATDFQAIYASVSGGTGRFYLTGFRW